MKTVAVGMSGGVDSSVAALLLKQAGYQVIGLFMKNWEEKDERGVCTSTSDYEDALAVCSKLGIPLFTLNFTKEYREEVFTSFLNDYKRGLTPNPDILCNSKIKFDHFFKKAKELGADMLATGHYCQTDPEGHLLRAKDPNKDQSYFLCRVKSTALKEVLFPIGHLLKPQVRQIAVESGLPTFAKKESMGICFIGKRRFTPFLEQYLGKNEGNFETPEGKVVGRHIGLPYYTIGQRQGLQIGGEGEAWFVAGKDIARNAVIVVQGAEHPALYSLELTATDLSWVHDAPKLPVSCTAKIRYRTPDEPCFVLPNGQDGVKVVFEKPQRAITPGQAVVFYDQKFCLGCGTILAPKREL